MKPLILVLALASLVLSSCLKKNGKGLEGMWKLSEMNILEKDSIRAFLGGMDGYLLYGKNYGALHLFPKGYWAYDSSFINFNPFPTPVEAQKLAMNYNYTAQYWINGDTVFHLKMSHSNPTEFGDTSLRIIKIVNDTLWMKPVEMKNNQLRLKWIRLKP